MQKITLLALHLGYGGVEKSIIILSNILSLKYEVEIIAVYKLLDTSIYNINDKVKIRYLLPNIRPNRKEFWQAVKTFSLLEIIKQGMLAVRVLLSQRYKMIKEIKKIDKGIIISTRLRYTKWLSRYGNKNVIKIAQEHRHHNNNKIYINKIIRSCYNIDYLMPVSNYLTNFYTKFLVNKKTKCIYIPHALDYIPNVNSKLNNKNIISIGRLSKEKGFTTLIDVFKIVNNKYPNWILNIIGDGIEKERLIVKINNNNLKNKVIMPGYKDQLFIEKMFLSSSIYVMTSYEESFGLVLIEAASCGIPLIAFDSALGAREIINNNITGYLIKDRNIEEMANKIIKLIEDRALRIKMGKEAKKSIMKYSKDNIAKIWFKFIDEISR